MPDAASRLRVLVAGRMVAAPGQGGAVWAVLQYVLGLRALGHDVRFVEPLEHHRSTFRARRALDDVADRFDLEGRLTLLDAWGSAVYGGDRTSLDAWCRDADVLLNLSGVLRDECLLAGPAHRVYVDMDPGFTQVWSARGASLGLAGHDRYVTVGLALGADDCPVPTGDVAWEPTLPPVDLAHWPVADEAPTRPFTSVGNWRSYGSPEHDGRTYRQRAHAVRALLPLPSRAPTGFELAYRIHPEETADLSALALWGWCLVDPGAAAGTPGRYRDFIAASTAEIGVPKEGYVTGRTGWFSDRSACYLACGRPVLAQDTGFGRALPVGDGLLAFGTVDEAVAGVHAILADPRRHRRAARELAEAHLDARRVLARLLERAQVAP